MGGPKSNRELCYYPVQSARKLPLSINDPGNSMSPSYTPVDSTSNQHHCHMLQAPLVTCIMRNRRELTGKGKKFVKGSFRKQESLHRLLDIT